MKLLLIIAVAKLAFATNCNPGDDFVIISETTQTQPQLIRCDSGPGTNGTNLGYIKTSTLPNGVFFTAVNVSPGPISGQYLESFYSVEFSVKFKFP